jgi:AcrR family transcriptional regulator
MAGRPRSAHAHGRVLDAAAALFAERGIDGASMDAISRTSGVSKATIYKHWPNKDALVLETLEHLHRMDNADEIDTSDVAADIQATLSRRASERTAALRASIMPHLIAYAARHPEFHKAWRARMLGPLRSRLVRLLERAAAEGRLSPDFDRQVGVALLVGPMLYSWVQSMVGVTLPDDLPARIVSGFWRAHGCAPEPEPAPASPRRRAAKR